MANARARQFRKRPTIGEMRLWKELRQLRRQGYHFRRQAPIDPYIVDFACFSQRLIIEVDGAQHDTAQGRKADAARDADLYWRGFKVLRFRNDEVRDSMSGVISGSARGSGRCGEAGVERERDDHVRSPNP